MEPEAPKPWDVQLENLEGGMAEWNDDEDTDESGVEADPGSELFAYVTSQHQAGFLTAKQACVIAWWAGKAGVSSMEPIGLPPDTVGSGDFKRLLTKVLRGSAETYILPVPAYLRSTGTRGDYGLHTLLPHEALINELQGTELQMMHQMWEKAPNYEGHPVVRAAAMMPEKPVVVPLSLFIDGVAYAKKDSLLVVSVQNLWTERRHIVAVLRKRVLCKCGCRGWDTLHTLFSWLRWCLQILADAKHPEQRHDGTGWQKEDKQREEVGGSGLPFAAAVLQLRADWAEIAHTLAVPQWKSAGNPCFLCDTSSADMFTHLLACGTGDLPWTLHDAETYEQACQECEIDVDPSEEQWNELRNLLRHDRRREGSRGLSLTAPVESLLLRKGDRLEPTEDMLDVAQFNHERQPARFWRRSQESVVLRRNPLLCKALGLDLPTVVAVDVLHTLCLGVHQQYVAGALWAFVSDRAAAGAGPGQENQQEANMDFMRAHYTQWLKSASKKYPEMNLSAVGDLSMAILGKERGSVLKAKAHETLTLLKWLADFLPLVQAQFAEGVAWSSAAVDLTQMYEAMAKAPMVVPARTQEDHDWEKKNRKKKL